MATKSGKPERKRSLRPEPSSQVGDRRAGSRPRSAKSDPSPPEITVRRGPVGRETLAAIAEDLAAPPPKSKPPVPKARAKLDTLGYEDRPRTASSKPPRGSSPELITIGHAPIGRATQEAIEQALVASSLEATIAVTDSAAASREPQLEPAEIFEISTFVVQGEEIFTKVSEQSRRDFVERRLLHRLPVVSMVDVERIDVSRGATAETVILRIWTRVGQRPG